MFKKLLEFGDRYASRSNWTDFALTKFCLFSMGLAAGTQVPKKYKKAVLGVSAAVFAASYVPLMVRLARLAFGKQEENI